MSWEIEYTDQFGARFVELTQSERGAITAAVDVLEARGPALRRPLVDTITATRRPNMKELRPPIGNIRILFVLDPRRMAILLLGGDKSNRWSTWHRENVPYADDLSDEHLQLLKDEGLIRCREPGSSLTSSRRHGRTLPAESESSSIVGPSRRRSPSPGYATRPG